MSITAEQFLDRFSASDLAILGLTTPFSFRNEELNDFGHGLAFDKDAYKWAIVMAFSLERHLNKFGSSHDFEKTIDSAMNWVERDYARHQKGGMSAPSDFGLIKSGFFSHELGGREPTNSYLKNIIADSVRDLEEAELIKDPFVETFGGVPIMIMGLVPVSFSRRTAAGDDVYMKISALFWEWEFHKTEKATQHYFSFRVFKAIEYFKKRVRVVWRDPET